MATIVKAPPAGTAVASGARVIPVKGYSRAGRARAKLDIMVHGLTNAGKTHLMTTLPAPFAVITAEPATTMSVLDRLGYGDVPMIVARTFDEFIHGIPRGPYANSGAEAFLEALPPAIEWIVIDPISQLLSAQHALHLAEQEDIQERKIEIARRAKKPEPGLDKFAVLDFDLNRARRIQRIIQAADRHNLWLAHTAPWSDDEIAKQKPSLTAGRPLITGQFRTALEGWVLAILYLEYQEERVPDPKKKGHWIQQPRPVFNLRRSQIPLVKHKWPHLNGKIVRAHLGKLLERAGEWPR